MPDTLSPSRLSRLADFIHEAGMLRHTPRSGYAFLGSGKENVAEHSFRTTVIGYVLGHLDGADPDAVARMCLFHDLHEARTGDFNYVNHRYDSCQAERALEDALKGTGLEDAIRPIQKEMDEARSREAQLANDADQLDLLCNLSVELSQGNENARQWIDSCLRRLRTDTARQLAEAVLRTDPQHWWRVGVEEDWWVDRGR
ncbi:MAG: HD domain-containing protein [Desulfovibrio sp.]|jgi:putative hydrolase of HD superfamily|nr:HD domain-containing protein [Desulfovibrio sp.]